MAADPPQMSGLSGLDETGLLRHRSHDPSHLLQRWRAVAGAARLRLSVIHETAGFPVYFITSKCVSSRPLYLSSGVHGDEAGSVLGLLEWAEHSRDWLRGADVIIIPLFNPAGLERNTRADAEGADLNRLFDDPTHPHIAGWRHAMALYQPRAAVCLHEDYDAEGLYAYELNRNLKLQIAETCLSQAEGILPRDPRRMIEGRPAHDAIIRRRRLPMFENLPEAVALYQSGTPCTLTFETPSEYSIATRALAHARLVAAACDFFR